MKKYISLAVSLILTILIWSMSIQSGDTSGSLSYEITLNASRILNMVFPSWMINLDVLHIVVRKTAHVVEYALLTICYIYTIRGFKIKTIWVIPIGLLVSIIDESLQMLADNRGPSLIDAFGFNFTGILTGYLIVLLMIKIKKKDYVS